jgi:3-oxoacyl-[acyl-carrier protein] reductase
MIKVSETEAFLLCSATIRGMNYVGQTVLVTGASRGIGKAIVDSFLLCGARVIGISTKETEFSHDNYLHLQLDLSDTHSFIKLLDLIPIQFQSIDILVNNAGIKIYTEFATSTVNDWEKTIDINLRAVYFLTQALQSTLAKSKSGRVINIASQSGVAHVRSSIEYGLSKAGVIYLTKSLARALAKEGITVNAVSPGRTNTDMTGYDNDSSKLSEALSKIPLGAINSPEEIAAAVLFLASDQAHNITGQVIGIDGGEALF